MGRAEGEKQRHDGVASESETHVPTLDGCLYTHDHRLKVAHLVPACKRLCRGVKVHWRSLLGHHVRGCWSGDSTLLQ